MNLLYCTSIAFSDKLANLVQVHAMSKEFQKQLGENFWLGVNYKNVDDPNIRIICFNTNKSYILAWRYFKFSKKNQIEYIYCRESRLLFFIILFNKIFWRKNLKYIYEVHAFLNRSIIDIVIDKALSFQVNYYVFITRNLADIFKKKYGLNKEKIIICPDAVDLNIFDLNLTKDQARQKLNLSQDKKIIGYTGRFTTMGMDKGITNILKSLVDLSEEVIFAAVGGSDIDVNNYKKQAAELGLAEKAIFIGSVKQNILAEYQKAFDALLMPFPNTIHYAYYMSPLKMFEYMASKRPIIASDLPSIREVLSERNAIIIRSDDPENLAKGIKQAIENEELAKKISLQAFKDVCIYTWEKRVENIINFVKQR